MRLFLMPGDILASMTGLPAGSDNRQILRMWANTVIWGALASIVLVVALA